MNKTKTNKQTQQKTDKHPTCPIKKQSCKGQNEDMLLATEVQLQLEILGI